MDGHPGRNFWDQSALNHNNKTTLKLPMSNQASNQFSGVTNYYSPSNNNNNNQMDNTLKRNYQSVGNQQTSPLKKRHLTQQIITPPPTSSADHTDDDDDDDDEDIESNNNVHGQTGTVEKPTNTKRDDVRRRAAHTAAEQKRRNAIRKGYDALQNLVPNSHLLDPISSQKVSKAAILKRSTDYLIQLNSEKEELQRQLEEYQKETFCLRTVQKTYEDILEMNINSRKNHNATIDDEHKFQLFQNIADMIFHSFDQAMQSTNVGNFSQFTATMIRWVEDSCRPSDINEIIRRVTENFKS